MNGLLIVNTGEGKGKTTAAFGLLTRALECGFTAKVIQFIKRNKSSEVRFLERASENITVETIGRGFTWESEDLEKDAATALKAWEIAESYINGSSADFLLFDELTYPINYKMIPIERVVEALKNRPSNMTIIITGRDAPSEIVELADTVTNMQEIKHHYNNGIEAQKGIEF